MLDLATLRGGRQPLVFALGVVGLAVVLTSAAVLGSNRGLVAMPTRTPGPDEILAKVDPVEPVTAAARTGAASLPQADLPSALALARHHVEAARRQGDPRFLGRAEAVLAPWWDAAAPPDEVLLLRATIRQGLHDFTGARVDLDALVVRRPDDAQALVTRAVVAMVTGDVERAGADCARVGVLAGDLLAVACAAPLATRGGGARAAYDRLGTLIAQSPRGPVVAWATTARGELARALDDDRAAEDHFRAALAMTPDDPYTLAQLADLLLDADRAAEVDPLLRDQQPETLVLRRAIALRRLHRSEAAPLVARLRAEIDASAARGDDTHLRERARYFLDVDPQPALALAAARGNWNLQREPIDVRTLLEAAAAASDPAAAAPALAWLDAGAIDDAVLTRARARLEGPR